MVHDSSSGFSADLLYNWNEVLWSSSLTLIKLSLFCLNAEFTVIITHSSTFEINAFEPSLSAALLQYQLIILIQANGLQFTIRAVTHLASNNW